MMALLEQVVFRRPFNSDGNSGNTIERVTLQDDRELLLKRVSPAWDWMARESHDDGRIGVLWNDGILDRVPAVIDHTIMSVEQDTKAWNVFMRDAGDADPTPRTVRPRGRSAHPGCNGGVALDVLGRVIPRPLRTRRPVSTVLTGDGTAGTGTRQPARPRVHDRLGRVL